jgi:putative nucleotidyltransferase with HDIG domain
MERREILKKLDRMSGLPTLPAIVMEINRMLQDYDITIGKICRKIETDQALVSGILRLVNSAFFGFQSKIGNISHALMLLGFNTVRNALVSVSVIRAFQPKGDLNGFRIEDFWKHSVAVAVTSRRLAEISRLHAPDDSFIAGLLHDIGKVILAQHFQDLFEKVWQTMHENHTTFYEAEKKVLSIDHAMIGGYVTKKWRLPAGLMSAIQCHHGLRESLGNDHLSSLPRIVRAADLIVYRHGENPVEGCNAPALLEDPDPQLNPHVVAAPQWFPPLKEEIAAACRFFTGDPVK